MEKKMEEKNSSIGDWIRISVLGSGSFGKVTLWRNQVTMETVAIKQCHQLSKNMSRKQCERWQNEIDILQEICHPNIIRFKPLDRQLNDSLLMIGQKLNQLSLLSMEYCPKGNLRHFMTSEPVKMAGLTHADDIYDILRDISSGLKYLHSRKIVHRDVKPENIVLAHCDDRSSGNLYKIIDLGYAKNLFDIINSNPLSFVGTLNYLAPEIFFNVKKYGPEVDYWSLAILTYELISGHLPFLPELTPFERFQRIKTKAPDDISMELSISGSVIHSTVIKTAGCGNFFNSCLKDKLQNWLRHALRQNPQERYVNVKFDILDSLQDILEKQLCQVFVVSKCEFYTYEIDRSTTRWRTLKMWIKRDTKLSNVILMTADGTVVDLTDDAPLSNNDKLIFVYKIDSSVTFFEGGEKFLAKLPSLLRKLFEKSSMTDLMNDFNVKKKVYIQSLTFVRSAHALQQRLRDAFELFVKFLVRIRSKLTQQLDDVIIIDTIVTDLNRAKKRLKKLTFYLKETVILTEIDTIFAEFDLKTIYDRLNSKAYLESFSSDGGDGGDEDFLKKLRHDISDVLKLTCLFYVTDKRLVKYAHDLTDIYVNWLEPLSKWMTVVLKNDSRQCQNDDITQIIKDNKELSKKLSDLIDTYCSVINNNYDSKGKC